jgi:quercetin dioxygenase-like cupin family protein
VSEARPQPYKVRRIHVVAKGTDVLVREYTLDPGDAIPWHRHSEVSDYYYGLEGMVVIETRNPAARHEIRVGQFATVPPQRSTTYPTRARERAVFCWCRASANTIS